MGMHLQESCVISVFFEKEGPGHCFIVCVCYRDIFQAFRIYDVRAGKEFQVQVHHAGLRHLNES